MPLYDYACKKCSHTFECLVTAKRGEPDSCPSCQSEEVERVLSLPALGRVESGRPATNCRGDGPPCGMPSCGRKE